MVPIWIWPGVTRSHSVCDVGGCGLVRFWDKSDQTFCLNRTNRRVYEKLTLGQNWSGIGNHMIHHIRPWDSENKSCVSTFYQRNRLTSLNVRLAIFAFIRFKALLNAYYNISWYYEKWKIVSKLYQAEKVRFYKRLGILRDEAEPSCRNNTSS